MVRAVVLAVACLAFGAGSRFTWPTADESPSILPNDNSTPAGRLEDGVLSLRLVAAQGEWFPEDTAGPSRTVYSFGEEGSALLNPGPLLRVPAGTAIVARVRNAIDGSELVVHGLHDRPGAATPLVVPASGSATVRFRVNEPGTYFYWATTRAAPTLRDRFGKESQLMGALIVDPPDGAPRDRVFVIGIEDDSAALPVQRKLHAAVVNGRSWPHGQIFDVTEGDTVRMRWINATDRVHPIHLHGFYFRVTSKGDAARDTAYEPAGERLAVTELLVQGQTMSVEWVPERSGNWLMHCHMAEHMSPHLRGRPGSSAHGNHSLDAMSGLVTGWRVAPRAGSAPRAQPLVTKVPRRLRLLVQSSPRRYGENPGIGFVLQTGSVPRADSIRIPGAPLVLTRDEPVEITVVNRLTEPTSIHWHGIELESYFDGVSGWSGDRARTSPRIAAGDSFTVSMTPPRAGTFIYHSHFEEERQLASGLYGALIVLEPGTVYDPETDLSWVLGQNGPGRNIPVLLNGAAAPEITMQAGRRYRIRLVNINPNIPLTFALLADSSPVAWRAVAKDGAQLPAAQATVRPASLRIGVGETYDFEYTASAAGTLTVLASNPAGKEMMKGRVVIR